MDETPVELLVKNFDWLMKTNSWYLKEKCWWVFTVLSLIQLPGSGWHKNKELKDGWKQPKIDDYSKTQLRRRLVIKAFVKYKKMIFTHPFPFFTRFQIKIGVLKFVSNKILPEPESFCLYIVAASDTRHNVANDGDLELRRIIGGIDWSNAQLVAPLYTLYLGVKSNEPEKRKPGANIRLRMKILPYLARCRGIKVRPISLNQTLKKHPTTVLWVSGYCVQQFLWGYFLDTLHSWQASL